MKIFYRTLIIFLIATTLLWGCATRNTGADLRIASGAPDGVWNPLGAALQKQVSTALPGTKVSVQKTTGAFENLNLLTTGKADLVFSFDYQVLRINQGNLPKSASGKAAVRILTGLYEQPIQIITLAGSGITSIHGLKGTRVSTGAEGSGTEEHAVIILQSLGLDPDKDLQRQKMGTAESIAALKSGTLDAFIWSGAAPTSSITDLASGGAQLVFLPVNAQDADVIMHNNPGVFHRALIRAGAYPGLAQDVDALAVTDVLAVMDSFPDDRATAVLSTLFDKKSELVPAWQGAADLTPGSGLAMLAPETRVYLHPAAAAFIQTRETLYQVSTINSLMTDHYDGLETIDMLKQKGDLGIGTFDGLEGEMVMLDGLVYQVIDTGKVVQPADTILTPFANVTRFERDINLNLGEVKNITDLQATLESMMPRKDAFYAIRVDGTFKHVKVRTVLKQTKPYPAFADVIKNQVVGDYQNVKGTIVGFWSPDYVGGVNLPAYNLHFISDNRSIGGHLIECDITDTRASLDETRNFEMKLNPDGG